jgi:hypothetical protein
VGILIDGLGRTVSLASRLRHLAAEKSTKNQRFLILRFDFLKI